MNSQPENNQQTDAPDQSSLEYNVDGEMLTEVEVSDDLPPDDDDESIWTDDGDNVEENEEEEDALGNFLFNFSKKFSFSASLFQSEMKSESAVTLIPNKISCRSQAVRDEERMLTNM